MMARTMNGLTKEIHWRSKILCNEDFDKRLI